MEYERCESCGKKVSSSELEVNGYRCYECATHSLRRSCDGSLSRLLEYVDRVEVNNILFGKIKVLKEKLSKNLQERHFNEAANMEYAIRKLKETATDIQTLPTLRSNQIAREPLLAK